MATNAIDDSIAQMQKAQADNAKLMGVSVTVNTGIQATAATTHTMNGASAAGGEQGKATGNAIKDAAKAA
jgi:hypothetical protein